MKPYEVPIDQRFRSAIEGVAARLAAGELEGLVEAGQLATHAVDPAVAVIERSGDSLVPLPPAWWEDEGAVMFPVREPDEWCALLPLWTRESGRSDLWLEVDLYVDSGDVRAVVERLFFEGLRP